MCFSPFQGATAVIVYEPNTNTPKKAKTLENALEIDGGGGILANGGKVNIWEFKSIDFILQCFVIEFTTMVCQL